MYTNVYNTHTHTNTHMQIKLLHRIKVQILCVFNKLKIIILKELLCSCDVNINKMNANPDNLNKIKF